MKEKVNQMFKDKLFLVMLVLGLLTIVAAAGVITVQRGKGNETNPYLEVPQPEMIAKSQRLAELDAALNMEDSAENRDERSESERPSVLADLKSKAEHIPPAKYSETREEVL